MAFPSSIDTDTPSSGTSLLTSPDHSLRHNTHGSAIVAIENKLGLGVGSAAANQILTGSGAGTSAWSQTWNNGTLGTAVINNSTLGTPLITGGTSNSATFGTPAITGGTFNGPTIGTPVIQAWDAWVASNETWTYSGVDGNTGTITVAADVTSKYSQGMKVKYVQGGTQNYGFISNSPSLASGTTTMTLYLGTAYALANAAISSNSYSAGRSPLGFPLDPSYWTVETSGTAYQNQSGGTAGTWYNLGTTTISIPRGVWNVEYLASVQNDISASLSTQVDVTLSTANNTESDIDFTTAVRFTSSSIGGQMYKRKALTLTSRTVYYLNERFQSGTATGSGLQLRSDQSKTFIRAICLWL